MNPFLPGGLGAIAIGGATLILKFTTDYAIFEPVVAPVSVILVGAGSVIFGLQTGNRA